MGRQKSCPACGGKAVYRLADGRQQCRKCRQRWSVHGRRSRLAEESRQGIARLFWRMVPAARGAAVLGINRKTLQRHYHGLRTALARRSEQELSRILRVWLRRGWLQTAGPASVPLEHIAFWILRGEKGFHVLFPEQKEATYFLQKNIAIPACAVVKAPDALALRNKELDKFRQQSLPGANSTPLEHLAIGVERLERFWLLARRRLSIYRGGSKKNFVLFIREMEFRFNYRVEREALRRLMATAVGPCEKTSAIRGDQS
jgi:transposase-like protein